MTRLLMIVAAAVVLGVGAVALGGAVTTAQEGDGPFGSILGRVADKLGVSEEELQTAFDEARSEAIDDAVADGSLTEEQAARLRERVEEGGPLFAGPRRGHGGGHHVLDAALQVLDIEKAELLQQFQDGNSLATVAEAEGWDVDDFEAELASGIQADIQEKVASGDITQEQADRILENLEEHIDRVVNRDPADGPPHRRGGFEGASFGETVDPEDVTA